MIFPHDDYAGKYSSKTFLNIILFDKPHSMYLQMIQGTGGVSFIAFLAMPMFYGMLGMGIGIINTTLRVV